MYTGGRKTIVQDRDAKGLCVKPIVHSLSSLIKLLQRAEATTTGQVEEF